MTENPYHIGGPALISFSGGRTSAYMLYHILLAYDGLLPQDVHVVFANTGKEREQTLRFVNDCSVRWNVPIAWVERIFEAPGFQLVSHNSASRHGEPFERVIKHRGFLPNAVARFCTIELKIRAMRDFMKTLGYRNWKNAIGLRYDEGARVLKALARNDQGRDPFRAIMPLSKAKVTRRDVMAFWAAQPFDLALRSFEGNCDLCFLKGRGKLQALMREHPHLADWWIRQEETVTPLKPSGARFVTEYSYRDLASQVEAQGHFFPILDQEEHDSECGLICPAAL
jgi:3'-phosphoadenosine 5'-phosphosulfate sulfotransferase (PAPS reductase)/FAD synthetase